VDANVIVFDNAYSDSVDGNDAQKLFNSGENLGVFVSNKTLVIDARRPVASTDTIFFSMSNMTRKQYKLQFVPSNLNTTGLSAFLKDNYLGTTTPVDLTSTNTVNFTVDTAIAASAASNRFVVVFRYAAPVVSAGVITTQAALKNGTVTVDWNVAGETAMKEYIVERAVNGGDYLPVDSSTATGNNGSTASYSWMDQGPVAGTNVYHIEGIGEDGSVRYSNDASVTTGTTPGISVYPNPVTNGVLHIVFTSMLEGNYGVRLVSLDGQVVYTGTLSSAGSYNVQQITMPVMAAGIYKLVVTAPDGKSFAQKVIIN
jgi:hypothetical protein